MPWEERQRRHITQTHKRDSLLDIRYDVEFGVLQTGLSLYESHPLTRIFQTVPDSPVQSVPSWIELELALATQFKLG